LREDDLKRVQKRREFPTRVTQRIQVALEKTISRVLFAEEVEEPLLLRLLVNVPLLRRIPARLIGMGVRPEHVRSPEVSRASGRGGRVPSAAHCEA
jgi:hypothetical protein